MKKKSKTSARVGMKAKLKIRGNLAPKKSLFFYQKFADKKSREHPIRSLYFG
jgi:hypothetical protein